LRSIYSSIKPANNKLKLSLHIDSDFWPSKTLHCQQRADKGKKIGVQWVQLMSPSIIQILLHSLGPCHSFSGIGPKLLGLISCTHCTPIFFYQHEVFKVKGHAHIASHKALGPCHSFSGIGPKPSWNWRLKTLHWQQFKRW
jgi:hypothetical protein